MRASAGRVVALVPLAVVAGALGIWAIDPGYGAHPFVGVLALGFAGAAAALARGVWWRLVLAGTLPVASGALFYVGAPTALDRTAYTRVERAWLAAVRPYPGAASTRLRTDPASGSDFGIDFMNPPETYNTSRTDELPHDVRPQRAADFYERELKRAGLVVDRFRLHLPDQLIAVDGQRGPVDVDVTIGTSTVGLIAYCQRNGPFDPHELEPPCRAP